LAASITSVAAAITISTPGYARSICTGQPDGTKFCEECYHTQSDNEHFANVPGYSCSGGIATLDTTFKVGPYYLHPQNFESSCDVAEDQCDYWLATSG
jgi:hypothetical protein